MKRTNKIIIVAIIIAVLLLGIGYAAITSVILNIAGTAEADPNQSNFQVKFTGDKELSDEEKVTAAVTNDTNATIKVVGLSAKEDSEYAEYTIQNVSKDISADLEVETTNSNEDYFKIESKLEKTSLAAGEVTKVKVTVELLKTPIEDKVEATVGVQITASPVEPGKEGSTQTPEPTEPEPPKIISGELGTLVTNEDNIGDYIDLGNDALENGETTNDWRILYVDEEKNIVYAILADYLPNSTGYATNAGLNTSGTYGVYLNQSTGNRATLLTKLTTDENWNGLAKGIEGSKVTGAPTWELITKSYNAKNEASLPTTSTGVANGSQKFDSSTSDYDLYIPHNAVYEGCYGYRLASLYESGNTELWYVSCTDGLRGSQYYFPNNGVRPVVSLPSDTNVELVNGVWTVTK